MLWALSVIVKAVEGGMSEYMEYLVGSLKAVNRSIDHVQSALDRRDRVLYVSGALIRRAGILDEIRTELLPSEYEKALTEVV